jgi:hypothetical protein
MKELPQMTLSRMKSEALRNLLSTAGISAKVSLSLGKRRPPWG